jgi:broad specificity phosphatase PhoE
VTALPVHTDDDLMELLAGSFEGLSIAAVRNVHGLGLNDSVVGALPEDAECWQDFVPRMCRAMDRWTERYVDENGGISSVCLVP